MRIAHVADFYLPRLGGIEMHVHDLAVRQHLAGHTVEVITSSPEQSGQPGVLASAPAEGLLVHRLAVPSLIPALLKPGVLKAGRALVRECKYDVVHVHAGAVSPLAFSAAALATEVPTVVTAHSLLAYLEPAYRLLDTGARWCSWPAVWTAVSEVAAEPLRRLVTPAPVHVLPNGIDPAQWRIEPLPRDPEEVVVVAVNRLAPRKRPQHLLAILRRVRQELPDRLRVRAVIVGEGPMRPRLERYLRRHNMTDWVSLPGKMSRDQIAALFARADLFVAPATLESFGIAALEARCAGLPVVARSEGGIGEFIRDGEDGLLTHSDADMAAAIVRLVADADLRTRLAAHNRATSPPLGWPDVLQRTMELYELAATARQASMGTYA
jgi:glycosyltransferase involved in cell wall biosynthesis